MPEWKVKVIDKADKSHTHQETQLSGNYMDEDDVENYVSKHWKHLKFVSATLYKDEAADAVRANLTAIAVAQGQIKELWKYLAKPSQEELAKEVKGML